MSKSVLRLLWLALLCAAIVGANAPVGAAKASKPTRIHGSFDFVFVSDCHFPGTPAPTGHVEILAYDDDPSFPTDSSTRQPDRISFVITYDSGFTWTPDAVGVFYGSDGSVGIAVTGWGFASFSLIDGGNPGSGLTGALNGDFPVTTDRMRYSTFGFCSDGWFYLTSGNINISSQ